MIFLRTSPAWPPRRCGPLLVALLGQFWPLFPAAAGTSPDGIEFFEG